MTVRTILEQRRRFFELHQQGATYANLFPDQVRALVVDAVLDPIAWVTGTSCTGGIKTSYFIKGVDFRHAVVHVLDDLKGGVDAGGFGDGFHEGIAS